MTVHDPEPPLGPNPAALNRLNERRFRVLLALLSSPGETSALEIAQRLPPSSAGSLHRDLLALEHLGLVAGTPRPLERQQGQRILYTADAAMAQQVFDGLADAVHEASKPRSSTEDRHLA